MENKDNDLPCFSHMSNGHHDPRKSTKETRQILQEEEEDMVTEVVGMTEEAA